MSNMYRAEIKMQNQVISITSKEHTVTVFKSQGTLCDYEVFDTGRESDIIEYVIAPMRSEHWQFVEESPTESRPKQ
jgi:hypothetical protein